MSNHLLSFARADRIRVCTVTMWISVSVRWWTPARCCKSATPAWSACWRGWPTCGSSPSTSWTPSCTRIVCSPPPTWCWTNSSPSTRSPSVPSLHGERQQICALLNYLQQRANKSDLLGVLSRLSTLLHKDEIETCCASLSSHSESAYKETKSLEGRMFRLTVFVSPCSLQGRFLIWTLTPYCPALVLRVNFYNVRNASLAQMDVSGRCAEHFFINPHSSTGRTGTLVSIWMCNMHGNLSEIQ